MVRPISAHLAQAVRPRRLPQSAPRVRQQQRFASSTPSTEEMQKKAQDVFASVQKGLGQAFEAGKKFLGPVGEKAGNLLGGTCFPCCPSSHPHSLRRGAKHARAFESLSLVLQHFVVLDC